MQVKGTCYSASDTGVTENSVSKADATAAAKPIKKRKEVTEEEMAKLRELLWPGRGGY